MSSVTEDVRLAVYAHFAETGAAPSVAELAARTGSAEAEVRGALAALHEHRDVVLDSSDRDRILMAHPFARPARRSRAGSTRTGLAYQRRARRHSLRRSMR